MAAVGWFMYAVTDYEAAYPKLATGTVLKKMYYPDTRSTPEEGYQVNDTLYIAPSRNEQESYWLLVKTQTDTLKVSCSSQIFYILSPGDSLTFTNYYGAFSDTRIKSLCASQ